MSRTNAFYAQSGGVTAVINASACGVIETARKHRDRIGSVYAGRNGILGALDEDLIDTGKESAGTIRALRHTPGGAFGSARYKLGDAPGEYERLIAVFQAHNIGYFFYNGGGDSADTCLKVSQLGAKMGYPITAIHVPKTVDNDLPLTDTSPGFGSAAKYVAVSTREAALDVASMARTSTQVFILEVMGRHAGWLAAAAGLAGTDRNEAPHIILFPEIDFDRERFLERARQCVERHGHCVIVVSEGARHADGRFLADAGRSDAFGHRQLGGASAVVAALVSDRLGFKCHYAIADYLQRSARHIASKVDVEQAYAVGRAAVELALAGHNSVMATIERQSEQPFRWTTGQAPLSRIANREKKLPRRFIRSDGFGISAAARRYLSPLVQGEDYPPYRDGLPAYVSLRNAAVPRKLAPWNEGAGA